MTREIWYSNRLVLTSTIVGFMTDAASLFPFQHIMQHLWLSFPVFSFSFGCIFFNESNPSLPPLVCMSLFLFLCVCMWLFFPIWKSDASISSFSQWNFFLGCKVSSRLDYVTRWIARSSVLLKNSILLKCGLPFSGFWFLRFIIGSSTMDWFIDLLIRRVKSYILLVLQSLSE